MAYDSAASISSSTPAAMPQTLYLDEKWKLSKKERTRSCSRPSIPVSPNSSSSSNPNIRRCALTRKCARLVKEQRARFYIMRRCVAMLICWRDYADA